MRTLLRFLLVTAAVLSAGCIPGRHGAVVPPAVGAPPQWEQGRQQALQAADAAPVGDGWLTSLGVPLLEPLLAEALEANPDLKQARARLAEAAAQVTVAGADLKPTLDASLEAGRSRRAPEARPTDDFSAALVLAFEPDIWNKLSDSARAALLAWQAEGQTLRALRQALAADLTRGWFGAVEAFGQLELSRQRVDNLTANLQVLEEGYRAGLISALDIHLARANLASERSRLAQRRQTLGESRRTLARLLGRYPAHAPELAAELPPFPGPVPAGLPATLLERRPDILAAALRLARDDAQLARRYKDRFPSLRLTARLGSSSQELGELLQGDRLVWSLLAGVTQPLFDGQRLAALEAAARARAGQSAADYLDTVLGAFQEVESALQQGRELAIQVAALRLSREESDLAEALAFEQYRGGLVDFITVLEAQRRAFNARSAYLEAESARWRNRIDLYLALGGDFWPQQDSNAANQPPVTTGE